MTTTDNFNSCMLIIDYELTKSFLLQILYIVTTDEDIITVKFSFLNV